MASFAVAGFAAFAPEPPPSVPVAAINQDANVTITAADPAVGLLAGRVAAMNFSTYEVDLDGRPIPSTPDVSALISAQAATNLTTTTVASSTPRVRTSTKSPTTTPASPRDYSNVPADAAPWRSLVEAYFAPADVDRALWVIHCESSGDPTAVHPSSSASGLFQHLPKFWEDRSAKAGRAGANILDPDSNVAVAAWLVYSGGGWRHWNPSAHCWG